jgi:hypothetical protein
VTVLVLVDMPEGRVRLSTASVIMITACGASGPRRAAPERGAERLATEPVDLGQLRRELEARLVPAA